MASYWQKGCDDARAGKTRQFHAYEGQWNGYNHGYDWGKAQVARERAQAARKLANPPKPDPPLKNPYMEAIEAVEDILQRLQTFTREFPNSIDKVQRALYIEDMLEVRDTLHRFRQAEMAQRTVGHG